MWLVRRASKYSGLGTSAEALSLRRMESRWALEIGVCLEVGRFGSVSGLGVTVTSIARVVTELWGGEGWKSCLCDVEGHISRAFTRELRDEARGLTDDAVLGVHKACHRC